MVSRCLESCVCHTLSPPFLPKTGLRQVTWTPHFCAAASSVSRLGLAPASNSLNEASRLNFFAGLCWGNSLRIRHASVTPYIRTMRGRKKEGRKTERVREREWETRITIYIYISKYIETRIPVDAP